MSVVSTIIGAAERVPLPDVIIRAAIHRLCSRTATRLATGNAESDAFFADEMAARAIAASRQAFPHRQTPGQAGERRPARLHRAPLLQGQLDVDGRSPRASVYPF